MSLHDIAWESIPQWAAMALAAVSALTDALRGKIYNRYLVYGLAVAGLWLGCVAAANRAGFELEYRQFPELGFFGAPPVEADAAAAASDPSPAGQAVAEAPVIGEAPPQVIAPEGKRVVKVGTGLAPWERPPEVSIWPPPEGHLGPEEVAEADAPDTRETLQVDHPPVVISSPPQPDFWVYAAKVAINASIALVAGFLLWLLGMWAAGDAKLFAVLATMLPLTTYTNAFWPIFPAYVLIFNTFLAMLALLIAELVTRFARMLVRPMPEEVEAWRRAWGYLKANRRQTAMGFVGALFFFLVIKAMRLVTRHFLADFADFTDRTPVYFVLLVIYHPLGHLMTARRWVGIPITVAVLLWVAYATVFPTPEYNFVSIIHMGSAIIVIMVAFLSYRLYLNIFDWRPVRVWELKPRMILAKQTIEILKEDKDMEADKLGSVGPDGLAAEQVETLRRWWIDRGKGGHIWVSRTIPFAPALLVGTILTVFLGGYLLNV